MSPSDERIAEREAENARVQALYEHSQEQIAQLLARVQELEARLAKDRHHSSKPPSSDPLGRKRPRSQRRRSGKQRDGQLGPHFAAVGEVFVAFLVA
jgi:transposase